MKSTLYITSFIVYLFTAGQSVAQQLEQSSLYMFNPLIFNPAYAGSKGCVNAIGIFREQWSGVKGAPRSMFFSVHSPINPENMALGLHVSSEQIGARSNTSIFADYAYTLNFEGNRKLNFGVSFGGQQLSVDYQKLIATDATETDYLNSFSQFLFNGGTGVYYYTDQFYAGLSIPRLLESSLSNNAVTLTDGYLKRHYFLSTGYVYSINSAVDLKTSLLVKYVANAPLTVDVNANLFLYKKVWAGIMYRYHEAIGVNIAYQIKESLMFGYAYDYPINGLNTIRNMGSHELMLSYTYKTNKTNSKPSFF